MLFEFARECIGFLLVHFGGTAILHWISRKFGRLLSAKRVVAWILPALGLAVAAKRRKKRRKPRKPAFPESVGAM